MLAAVLKKIGQDAQVCHLHHTVEPLRPRLAPKTWFRPCENSAQEVNQQDAVAGHCPGRPAGPHDLECRKQWGCRHLYSPQGQESGSGRPGPQKGDEAQEVFYPALSQSEPFLLQELEDDPIRDKVCSPHYCFSEYQRGPCSLKAFRSKGLQVSGPSRKTEPSSGWGHDPDVWCHQLHLLSCF